MNARDEINSHLSALLLELNPTDDPDEERRRHQILVEAGKRALAAANDSPGIEPSRARMRAIIPAMMAYGRARLVGKEAVFEVPRSSNGKFEALPRSMVAMIHDAILGQLQAGWDPAPERPVTRDDFESGGGRFGEAQLRGIQKRFDTEAKRIDAILNAARDLRDQTRVVLPDYEVSPKKARQWLRKLRKPSAIADELLADYLNAVARNRDEIVARYNRNVDEFVKSHNEHAPEPHRKDPEALKIDPAGKSELKPNLTGRWVKTVAQEGREKLVNLRRQDEGLKRREISQRRSMGMKDPEAD